jgi:hypothetical protein
MTGWPDELVKNYAQMEAKNILVKINAEPSPWNKVAQNVQFSSNCPK